MRVANIFHTALAVYSLVAPSQISDGEFFPVPKVLDGEDIGDREKYPHFVRIYSHFQENDGRTPHCCGVLISSTEILSAAHCFYNETENMLSTEEFIVVLGCNAPFSDYFFSSNYFGPCHIHRNFSTRIHPQFNPSTFHNDIAIIDLSDPEPLFNIVPTNVDLTHRSDGDTKLSIPKIGANCFAIGWGCVDNDQEACGVQTVALKLVDHKDCVANYEKFNWSPESQLCAKSSEGSKLCGGDSGGGLFCWSDEAVVRRGEERKNKLVGILSFGDDICDKAVPKVFTRLGAYFSQDYTTLIKTGDDDNVINTENKENSSHRWTIFWSVGGGCIIILLIILVIFLCIKRKTGTQTATSADSREMDNLNTDEGGL